MVQKKGVLPVITIAKDSGGVYTYNPHTSTFDFALLAPSSFNVPVDAAGGSFSITISAPKADWDTSKATGISKLRTFLTEISEGNEVTIAAGKTSSTTNLFRGIIEDIVITEKNPNFATITLSGPDFGSAILKHTIVNGQWIQRKASNGVDLDTTDTTTLLFNIIDDMVSNTAIYPVVSDGITAYTKGLNAVSASFCMPPPLTIPQFYANMEFLDDKLSELDEIGMTTHYVDFDKNLIVKQNTLTDSGILLVDNPADSVAATWNTTKLGYIQSSEYTMSLETHRKRLFGLGGDQRLENDQQRQLTTTAFTKNDTSWLAMKFQPFYSNIESLAVYVDKVGTPSNLDVLLIENDATNNKPQASTIIHKTIDKDKITGTAGWHYIQVNQPVDPGRNYWVVLQETGDTNNYYRWYRTSSSTNYTISTSSDGLTWTTTTNTDGFAYRVVSTTPLMIPYPTVGLSSTDKHFYEEVIRRPDITQVETMQYVLRGLGRNHFKSKHIIKAKVYAPDTLLQSNQIVRIRKQNTVHQVDDQFVIGHITYRFDNVLGYLYQDIEAVRYVDFP